VTDDRAQADVLFFAGILSLSYVVTLVVFVIWFPEMPLFGPAILSTAVTAFVALIYWLSLNWVDVKERDAS